MVISADFWRDKNVLVTGHTGFKGAWLSLWLDLLGANVSGYSLSVPTDPSLFELIKSDRLTSVTGDIRNFDELTQAMRKAQPEIVIHMAAQSLVRESYKNPVETYATNVMGTANLLESVRLMDNVKAVIIVTSDKCYENQEWLWGYRESEPMGGYDPYSSSKGCAELVTAAYRNSFFNPSDYAQHGVGIASARAGNVIGGGDWASDRLIPDIIRAWHNQQKVIIRYPQAIRPWQHVLEPLSGYLTLAENLYNDGVSYSGGWNFGSNDTDAKPVGWIVTEMAKIWGDGAAWIQETQNQPHEAHYLKLDCAKAKHYLNWQPKLDIRTALSWVVDWAKAWETGADMRKFTANQIVEFSRISEIDS